MRFLHTAGSAKPVAVYGLDVIVSVGYRVRQLSHNLRQLIAESRPEEKESMGSLVMNFLA